jgi:hypothetical protein
MYLTHSKCLPNAIWWHGFFLSPLKVATLEEIFVEIIWRKAATTATGGLVRGQASQIAHVIDGAYPRVVEALYVPHAFGMGHVSHKK